MTNPIGNQTAFQALITVANECLEKENIENQTSNKVEESNPKPSKDASPQSYHSFENILE